MDQTEYDHLVEAQLLLLFHTESDQLWVLSMWKKWHKKTADGSGCDQ